MGSESSNFIKTSLEKYLAMAGTDIEIDSPAPAPAPVPAPLPPPPPPLPPPRVQQQWQQPSGFVLLGQHAPHAVEVGGGGAMNRPYVGVQKPFMLPVTGAATNAHMSVWKRGRWSVHEDGSDSSAEKKKRRMIRNRESAARSRARKQACNAKLEAELKSLRTENEMLKKSKVCNAKLEAEVKSLRIENEMLKKSKENLLLLSNAPPPPEPKHKLRRTASSHF